MLIFNDFLQMHFLPESNWTQHQSLEIYQLAAFIDPSQIWKLLFRDYNVEKYALCNL